jgi:hypothetical protein
MRKLRALWIGSMLLPACLKAGLIYGSVIKQGRAVPNTHIKIQCPGGSAEGDTAGDGSYRIQVSAEGRCTLSLPSYSGASVIVPSYAKPAQYDLELVPSQGGSYDLRIR